MKGYLVFILCIFLLDIIGKALILKARDERRDLGITCLELITNLFIFAVGVFILGAS